MASPIRPGEYLAGAVVFGLFRVLITFTALSALAWVLLAFGILNVGPMLAVDVGIMILFRDRSRARHHRVRASVRLCGRRAAILTPFAAVFYPVVALPGWAQGVAAFMPPAHVFEFMRAQLAGGDPPWGNIWAAVGLRPRVPRRSVRLRRVDARQVPPTG